MKSIYIGNLSHKTTQNQLYDLFAQFGEVLSIRLLHNKKAGKFVSYGFVEMEDENAQTAISLLRNTTFLKRVIVIDYAKDNTQDITR